MSTLLSTDSALLLVIDIQEKFLPVLHNPDQVVQGASRLIKGCNQLNVPIVVSEQYPQGLGPTVDDLKALFTPSTAVITKTAFGCCGDPSFESYIQSSGRTQIIVCGLEAHVCVNQTVVRLLELGYSVALVEDALGTRHASNLDIALRKLTQLGALPYSVEMVLFELLREASHPAFKSVQQLIR